VSTFDKSDSTFIQGDTTNDHFKSESKRREKKRKKKKKKFEK